MNQSRLIIGIIVILVGLSFMFNFPFLKIFFALAIILLGLSILFGKDNSFNFGKPSTSHEDELKRVLIFSGINQKVESNDFQGGEIVAVFGGGEVDLSEVKTKRGNLKLSVVAVFGGLKVIIPKNWSVKSEGVGILGGFDNKAQGGEKKSVVASIEGVAIFGGVEIVN